MNPNAPEVPPRAISLSYSHPGNVTMPLDWMSLTIGLTFLTILAMAGQVVVRK